MAGLFQGVVEVSLVKEANQVTQLDGDRDIDMECM